MPGSDLEAISEARARLREEERALAKSLDVARQARAELELARRRDPSGEAPSALADASIAADEAHKTRLDALSLARRRLQELLEPIRITPEAQLATQARGWPMALLPVRIETRLRDGKLLIRIYPDQIHMHRHGDAITLVEAEAARTYWRVVGSGGDEKEAWRLLASQAGETRARFLARRLRPGPNGAEPVIETVGAPLPPRPEARLLPTAWCATLLDADGGTILRKWSKPVAERLVMSPAGDLLESLAATPDDELPLDPEARWLVDFKEALDRGMAIEIAPDEFGPAGLPHSISRLVVVGSNWTMTPDAAASALAEHLVAHSYSGGFGLPAHGTPTNRGLVPAEAQPTATTAPAASAPQPDDDLSRLVGALGLPSEALELAGSPGTGRASEKTARAVHTALWGSCFGFYLSQALNPLVPEGAVGDTRLHVRNFVRPAGPFPTIQVGRQPYGVLPVLATPVRTGMIEPLGGYEGQLARVLANARALAEGYSPEAIATGALPFRAEDVLASIPNLHEPGPRPANRLAEILKLGPLARTARVRPTLGAAEREAASESTDRLKQRHSAIVRLLLSKLAGGLMISPWQVPLIFQLVVPGRPRFRLDGIPWVSADLESSEAIAKAVARMRDRITEAAGDPARVRQLLATSADQAETLLEGLLLLSGAFEYWEAATRAVGDHLIVDSNLTLAVTPAAASAQLASASLIGIDVVTARDRQVAVETVAQMLTLAGPETGGKAVITHLQDLLAGADLHPAVRDIRAFDDALGVLAERPAREVDQALRGLLDAGSHRLDAWITSLASRRLAAQRERKPTGIHLGCYGIIHDLLLDPGHVSSEGYVHVPSANHAVTAAVLRSGHLANRAADPNAFAIQLTSGRVREARGIAEGMAAGQPASALLGYQFERWLIDDKRRAKYIGPLRQMKPLPFDAGVPAGITEVLPPQDVVDGLALAEAWEKAPDALIGELQNLMSAPVDPKLKSFLTALTDLKDAFLDLWVAEATHQMIQGNEPRMAAALATLDRQERPPEPRVTDTPRNAWTYTQRVVWALPADTRDALWPEDLIARIEPVANAMAAALLGKPDAFRLSATIVDADGTPVPGEPHRAVKLSELGLSPLALARAAAPAGGQGPSPLELAIARRLSGSAPLPAGAGLQLDAGPQPDLPRLLAQLRAVRSVLFGRPVLGAHSLGPPAGPVPGGVADNALHDRAQTLKIWLAEQAAALKSVLATRDPAGLKAAIDAAAAVAALPDGLIGGSAQAQLLTIADSLRATFEGWLALWSKPPVDANAADLEKDKARIRLVLGEDFPVLAPFQLPAALREEIRASLADQAALTGDLGPREIRRWRRAMGLVRPRFRAFSFVCDAARNLANVPTLRIAQLPHRAGARWASLPFEGAPPRDVQLSLALAGEIPAGEDKIAGLIIDDWTEAVPERTAPTSLTFHYDAPAARPPQSILLAVDAGLGEANWSADALVATVNEAFDLARLRLLPPSRIPGHGVLLPTTFLPRNLSEEMPSLDLLGRAANAQAVSAILGKTV